ncbi:hypothetical protein SISNIDRAFT_482599 [Sistotremastrum niveocremeum HHB9708]|uniref:Uncharacterized protein n=1 Tax=Sistotremastrum niveocremeum HHB9708 TaxID=1314777 RepID=A0A164YD58_9AGAM|nr:hypothetical protein SISNIDRAFT_482599 [Sistotremastrum niveocremeum HHB9708]
MSFHLFQGLLGLPGASAKSRAVLAELLQQNYEQYHCLFHPIGFHNHLPHHLLTAYDLGASPSLLKAIYENEKLVQRAIDPAKNGSSLTNVPAPGDVTAETWKQWLGDERAYFAYLHFFSEVVPKCGISVSLEKYIFSSEANSGGACMLLRLFSLLMHPLLQLGFGTEFNSEIIVAEALAQTAVHQRGLITPDIGVGPNAYTPSLDLLPEANLGLSLMEVLREVYDDPLLEPIPYDGGHDYPARHVKLLQGGRGPRVQKLVARWFIDLENVERNVEECLWMTTLILFSSGRKDRMIRLDFFTAHFHTSALSLLPTLKYIGKPQYKADFLRMWLYLTLLLFIDRGRPEIKPQLLMSYTDTPRPPIHSSPQADASALANPALDDNYNPWPAMLASTLHHPDTHVLKVFRTLYFAAHKYGTRGTGEAPGAFHANTGIETHSGISQADGTIFVRAAGMLLDTWGWVTHGESKGYWDRSAIGWEEAWAVPDEVNAEQWKVAQISNLEDALSNWQTQSGSVSIANLSRKNIISGQLMSRP